MVARRSHNPKVVSSILTFRMLHADAIDVDRAQLPADTRASTPTHSNSARAMRRAHYAESRVLTVCSLRLWSTMPHIMAATVAHHAGGQRISLTWVLAMAPAHSRCRACVWRPRPSTPHAQMAAASAHGAGGWRAGSFEFCLGLLAASARCSTAAVSMSVPVAWLAASAATWRLDPDQAWLMCQHPGNTPCRDRTGDLQRVGLTS